MPPFSETKFEEGLSLMKEQEKCLKQRGGLGYRFKSWLLLLLTLPFS
jgi:hypothetical protein